MFFSGMMDFLTGGATLEESIKGTHRRKRQFRTPKPVLTQTICGLGTVGIGAGQTPEPLKYGEPTPANQQAFKEWLEKKRNKGAFASPTRTNTSWSPSKEGRERRVAVRSIRQQIVEQHREQAKQTLEERQKISQLLAEQKDRRLIAVRERARELAIQGSLSKEERAIIQQEKREISDELWRESKEEMDALKAELREEKETRLKAIQIHKKMENEIHSISIARNQTEKEKKLQKVLEEKKLEEERLERWRQRMRQEAVSVQNSTKQLRTQLKDGRKESRTNYLESVSDAVRRQREEESMIKQKLERLRQEHEQKIREEIGFVKEQQQTVFAEKLFELQEERREKAAEVRQHAQMAKMEMERERRERQQEARERAKELKTSRTNSPSRRESPPATSIRWAT